jgi:DNA-binding IclR family transcriptional regulator
MQRSAIQLAGQEKEIQADRAYRVWRAMVALGPGAHKLDSVMRLSELPRTSTHRMLKAGVRVGVFKYLDHGLYALAAWAQPSPETVRALPDLPSRPSYELIRLQKRTGQVAVLFSQLLIGAPSRLCVELSYGQRTDFLRTLTSTESAPERLRLSALHADAAGLAIMAHLDQGLPSGKQLRVIRSQGWAKTASPLPGWEMVASPVWRGNALVGAIGLIAHGQQMRESTQRYVQTTMDAAAALGLRLQAAHATRAVELRAV